MPVRLRITSARVRSRREIVTVERGASASCKRESRKKCKSDEESGAKLHAEKATATPRRKHVLDVLPRNRRRSADQCPRRRIASRITTSDDSTETRGLCSPSRPHAKEKRCIRIARRERARRLTAKRTPVETGSGRARNDGRIGAPRVLRTRGFEPKNDVRVGREAELEQCRRAEATPRRAGVPVPRVST